MRLFKGGALAPGWKVCAKVAGPACGVALPACILQLILFGLTFGACAQTGVNFPDPNLEEAVRRTLGRTNGTISAQDMLSITNLEAFYAGVIDLSGLEGAKNLTFLQLANNEIRNLSPLYGLSNLTFLDLSRNPVADCSPLSSLTRLTSLYLDETSLSSLECVSGLSNLRDLFVNNNQLADIAPLLNLPGLQWLGLGHNSITNLSLAALTNLQGLSLSGSALTNADFLPFLPNLQFLDLSHNRLRAVPPLAGLTNLNLLYLDRNLLTNLSGLSLLPNLWAVDVNFNLLDLSSNSAAMAVIADLQNAGENVYYQVQRQKPFFMVQPQWVIAPDTSAVLSVPILTDALATDDISLGVTSSDDRLISDDHLLLSGINDEVANLLVTPNPGQTGTTTISMIATDEAGLSDVTEIQVHVVSPQSVDPALINTNFSWISCGTPCWFGQTNVTHDGALTVESGGPGSWIETTLNGPGTLTFWWRGSNATAEPYYWARIIAALPAIGFTNELALFGGPGWHRKIIGLPAGVCFLRWEVNQLDLLTPTTNTLWLSDINFSPGDPASWMDPWEVLPVPRPPGTTFGFVIHGELGALYNIQTSVDLQSWANVGRVHMLDSEFWFPDTSNRSSSRFFRLQKFQPQAHWMELTPDSIPRRLRFTLHGQSNEIYVVETSTNLATWSALNTVTNAAGTISWPALESPVSPRFYRTRLQIGPW